MVGLDYCLIFFCSFVFLCVFLCVTSSVSFTGFYTEDEPLKTAHEKVLCRKNPFQNQHYMSQNGLLTFSDIGKRQGSTNKQRTKKKGSTWNRTKSKIRPIVNMTAESLNFFVDKIY